MEVFTFFITKQGIKVLVYKRYSLMVFTYHYTYYFPLLLLMRDTFILSQTNIKSEGVIKGGRYGI